MNALAAIPVVGSSSPERGRCRAQRVGGDSGTHEPPALQLQRGFARVLPPTTQDLAGARPWRGTEFFPTHPFLGRKFQ
jgi:hypothetical protein